MTVHLTTLLAIQRRALIRIDNCTRSGRGSRVGHLSDKTKDACRHLFEAGLIEVHTEPDGELWYRTTQAGRTLREEGEV